MGHWPTYPKTMLRLPTSIVNYQDLYTKFYTSMSKHNQRVLTWQHSLAQAILEANFPNGIRALEVSAYQACVLLLFNNGQNNEILSYEQLRSGTDLGKIFCLNFFPIHS